MGFSNKISHRTLRVACLSAALSVGLAFAGGAAQAQSKGWSGFYAGASLGVQWQNNDWTTNALGTNTPVDGSTSKVDFSQTAARLGLYGGYNFQIAPTWVIGAEADFGGNFGSTKRRAGVPGATYGLGTTPDQFSSRERFDGSLRLRGGYVVLPELLVFGTGGIAFQDNKYSASCPGVGTGTLSWCGKGESSSKRDTLVGWTLGAGLDYKITGNIVARAEYRYANYGKSNSYTFLSGNNAGVDSFSGKGDIDTHTLLIGVSYAFGGL